VSGGAPSQRVSRVRGYFRVLGLPKMRTSTDGIAHALSTPP
jgi:hypothetical protein